MARTFDALVALAQRVPAIDSPYPLRVPTFHGPAAATAVETLEAHLTRALPADYRRFLLESGGVTAMDVFNGYALLTPDKAVAMRADPSIPQSISDDAELHACVPIGADGGGNLFLLTLPDGRVWKWRHDRRTSVPVAESFDHVLERVVADWEHFVEGDAAWEYLSG